MQTSFVILPPAPAAVGRAATASTPAVPAPGNEPGNESGNAATNWLWVLFLLGTAAFAFVGPTCAWQ